jgi:hypothetical protein
VYDVFLLKMPMRGIALLVLAVLAGQAGKSSSDAQPVNILMASKGWQMGKQPVTQGQKLPTTAVLTTEESGELVLSCPQNGWLAYSCNRYPCRVSACATQLPDVAVHRIDKGAESGSTPDSSWVHSFVSLLTRESRPPVTLGVRGGGNPNDAVVLERGEEVHLAPALLRVLEGEYCFGLTSLSANRGHSETVFRLAWNKSDEPEGIVKLQNVQAGVYALEKKTLESSGTCSADPKAVPAWILIAPESDFQDLATRWKSNRAWFDQLSSSGANPAVVTAMHHAAIADLSSSLK